jgi:hypothetical protein
LKKRVYDVQIGNPRLITCVGLIPGTVRDEQGLHETFEADRIRGEWFNPSETLLTFIREKAGWTNETPWKSGHNPERLPIGAGEVLVEAGKAV